MESKKTKVYVSIPTTGTVVDSQQYVLRDIAELYSEHVELVFPNQCVRRVFHDFARNAQVDEFLASDCDILWFLDSDITPPVHVMDLVALHKDKWQAAGAAYPVFMSPGHDPMLQVVMTCYAKNPSTGALSLTSVPKEGEDFVDGLATGCLFIKREVFDRLEKPYFEFKFEEKSRNLCEGEDLGFCKKLSALGIKFFTDFSMVCNHRKTVDLLDVNNYAITYANNSVIAYSESVKELVKDAATAAYKRGFEAGSKKSSLVAPNKTIWTP